MERVGEWVCGCVCVGECVSVCFQVMTEDSLRLCLELMSLSRHRYQTESNTLY